MAKMTRVQKLDRKGIVWFEWDGVFAHLSRKQSGAVDGYWAVRRPLITLVAALGAVIRKRMYRGVSATGEVRLNRRWRTPIGRDTGGMWDGMQAHGVGLSGATLDFGGQSEAHPAFAGMRADLKRRIAKGHKIRATAWDTIRNDIKANSVYNRHDGYNVLEPSPSEIATMASVIGNGYGRKLWAEIGGVQTGTGFPKVQMLGADESLRAKLQAAWTA